MEEHNKVDLNAPTMGEKLEIISKLENHKATNLEKPAPSPLCAKPPSADSVHILLKQALHADDRALLLDCLFTNNEMVIQNTTTLLDMSDVHKLLKFILSIMQSRGAILACVLPWLRSLLLEHATGILSQESSLHALNSLKQMIDSRVSTYQLALQLSTSVDLLCAGAVDEVHENGGINPIIFEDKDEDESEDAMETDEDESEDAM